MIRPVTTCRKTGFNSEIYDELNSVKRGYKMKKFIISTLAAVLSTGVAAEQYNMSLNNELVTRPNGSITTAAAAAVGTVWGIEHKSVVQIADGVYRLGGWGLTNRIAIEGNNGWIIVDSGHSLEESLEQREALEEALGEKIHVAALLYTHSHYVWGAKAWQDEGTEFYAHEDMVKTLREDSGLSPTSGNFSARILIQFGSLHPKNGPDAFPNAIGFPVEELYYGSKAFVPPTITFADG